MQVQLHENQYAVASDPHRFRVLCAGRRFGKSVLARMVVLKWALENVGTYWIVSPSYKQSEQIHWRELKKEVPKKWIRSKNEVKLSMTLINGSIIELKGAENPDSLRGVKLRGLVIDEIASIRNWDWLWGEVLGPTLADYSAPALFISTPKGFNHFYELYNLGQAQDSDYKSWTFTTYDNPFMAKEEVDRWREDQSEDTFAQEYLADFRRFTGAIFKSYNRDINIIEPFDIPSHWSRGRGFDFGRDDPTASILFAIDDHDNWFVENVYKRTDTVKGHTELLMAENYGKGFVPCYGDPSGGQMFDEYASNGFPIMPATKYHTGEKSWVQTGYEILDGRFKAQPGHTVDTPNGPIFNAPKLFILNTPHNLAFTKEVERAEWKASRDGQTMPVLDDRKDPDGHFDLIAAARYFAVSFKGQPETVVNDFSKWSLG